MTYIPLGPAHRFFLIKAPRTNLNPKGNSYNKNRKVLKDLHWYKMATRWFQQLMHR